MLEAILACVLTLTFSALAATSITSMVFSIIEDRKQAKRNEEREKRDSNTTRSA